MLTRCMFPEWVICSHIFGEFTFVLCYGLNVKCPSQVQVFEHLVPQLVMLFGKVLEPWEHGASCQM